MSFIDPRARQFSHSVTVDNIHPQGSSWTSPQFFDSFGHHLRGDQQRTPQILREMEPTWEYISLSYKAKVKKPSDI